ncbi:MAG TPA: hypothetical protein VGA64_11795 [Candidatus Polarisedimenticolia bacterium]
MIQIVSIVGAVLILAAYAAHQAGRLGRESSLYHLLNVAGGLILGAVAVHSFQVGFIILEGVWTVISLIALVRLHRGPSRV